MMSLQWHPADHFVGCSQVDLIAVDFFGERMRNAPSRLQLLAYLFLFLGAVVMCLLAKWA